jgi:hypothetical protein
VERRRMTSRFDQISVELVCPKKETETLFVLFLFNLHHLHPQH